MKNLASVFIRTALENHVTGFLSMFEDFRKDTEFIVHGLGRVKLVDYNLNSNFENENNPVWMVFDIEGTLYKVTGSKSSYGNSDWYGDFTQVEKKEIVEYVYV